MQLRRAGRRVLVRAADNTGGSGALARYLTADFNDLFQLDLENRGAPVRGQRPAPYPATIVLPIDPDYLISIQVAAEIDLIALVDVHRFRRGC